MDDSVRPKLKIEDAKKLLDCLDVAINFVGLDDEHLQFAKKFSTNLQMSIKMHSVRKQIHDAQAEGRSIEFGDLDLS
jgi:hypothetical protein